MPSTHYAPYTLTQISDLVVLLAAYFQKEEKSSPSIAVRRAIDVIKCVSFDDGSTLNENDLAAVSEAIRFIVNNTGKLPPYSHGPIPAELIDALRGDWFSSKAALIRMANITDAPQPKTTGDTMTATAAPTAAVAIDPAFIGVINPALAAATKGAVTDINALLGGMGAAAEAEKLRLTVVEKDAMIADLTAKLSAAAARPMPTEIVATGELPEAKIVMKLAAEVFYPGKKVPALGFEIPTIEWSGPNPNVPAINPHYRFDLKRLTTFLSKLVDGENTMLTGHTGTGKTSFVQEVAARLGFEFYRVNFDSEITRLDLIGRDVIKVDPVSGKTVSEFIEGILPKAMVRPALLCLDELDFIRSDVSPIMYRVTENQGLMLNEDGGRIVMPHPLLRIVGTANTKLAGDEFGAYQGAKPQPLALRNRFTAWIEFDYLNAKQEVAVLRDYVPGIAAEVAETFIRLANEVRKAFNNGQILDVITPRDLVSASRLYIRAKTGGGTDKEAMDLAVTFAFINRMTRQDAGTVREISERITK